MNEQLELIARADSQSGCNFSRSPLANTWFINLRITDSQTFPFIHCNECPKRTCYRFQYGRMRLLLT